MIKLIITDMDGTFLNSQGDFNRPRYKQVKQMLDAQGVIFAVCTGKQCERVEELLAGELHHNVWIMGDSAARIKYNGHDHDQAVIDNPLALKLLARLTQQASDYVIIACTPNGAYLQNTYPPELIERIRRSYTNVQLIDDYQTISDDFIKITIYDPTLSSHQTYQLINDFNDKVNIVISEPAWIDITQHGLHKGTTIQRLQAYLAITPQETMVFGDGLNDRELIASGDYSFAVSNAVPEIKAAARYITRSNDDDGVLQTIEQMIGLQSQTR